MIESDPRAVVKEFKAAVNMSAAALMAWLDSPESKAVGSKRTERSESVGHRSGKKIVTLLGKHVADFTADDIAHAKKVVGYIRRHLAQKPDGNISDSHWRFSLMNWGHDPLKQK
jgi:Protein of unknown function (DUF3140)